MNHGGTPIEFRPVSMTLSMPRKGMDFFRAKLPSEVGDMLQPYTRSGAKLGFRKTAEVRLNGDLIQTLLFIPDGVSYGQNFTHLKLYDTIKAMDDGVVDKQWSSVTLQDAYQHVFDQVDNDIVEGPFFSLAENTTQRLLGDSALPRTNESTVDVEEGFRIKELDSLSTGLLKHTLYAGSVQEAAQSQTQKLTDSYFAIDFNKESPLKAITKLNKKFSVNTWTSRSGAVYVGYPEANSIEHIAAPDDQRIWRYKDPQISHPREPVKSVIVEGAWVDEPGISGLNDIASWFNPNDESGFGDAIALGYAERKDISNGITFTVKNTKTKKNSLQDVAEVALREKMKKQSSGTIEIDPSISGEQATPVESVRPGDIIRLVPPDHIFDNPTANSGAPNNPPASDDYCGSYVRNENYVVSEVEHQVNESGDWMVSLDVGRHPDADVGTVLKYWVPKTGETIKPGEFEEFGIFEESTVDDYSEIDVEDYPEYR